MKLVYCLVWERTCWYYASIRVSGKVGLVWQPNSYFSTRSIGELVATRALHAGSFGPVELDMDVG